MKLKSLLDYRKNLKQMRQEDCEMFLHCSMAEQKTPNPTDMKLDEAPIGVQIMFSRLKWAGFQDKVSFWVKLFLAGISDRPGNVVMWAYTMADLAEREQKVITMTELAFAFPDGFPSPEDMQECWDAQKGRSMGEKNIDNCMDVQEFWK